MKKTFIIMLIILLTSTTIVSAGKSIPLDFDRQESYVIPLFEKDRIIFEFDGDNHSIILDDIKDTRVEFDVFIYQERNKLIEEGDKRDAPIYAFADTQNLLKFDLNRDDVFDFELDVLDYDSRKALIKLTRIEEVKKNTLGSPTNSSKNNVPNVTEGSRFYNNVWFLVGFLALIIAVLIFIIFDKFTNGKRWSYH